MSAATKVRRAIEIPRNFVYVPGVYDRLSARTALEVGFDCFVHGSSSYLPLGMESLTKLTANVSLLQTGAGTTTSRLGQPDLAIASLPVIISQADLIANLDPSGPLIADMDTEFGGPIYGRQSCRAVCSRWCCWFSPRRSSPNKKVWSSIWKGGCLRLPRRNHVYEYGQAGDQRSLAMANVLGFGASPSISRDEAKELGVKLMIRLFATLAPAYLAIRTAMETI
ncbi:carboxyphosphonoenolpyruvate phosphonomutase [Venturia nashicola]|uniref:Carboxyphosphonoenolpyruvate phosphonomutase n=1 Tax=Venturia nashicola TaxID=86259 RepID=A0A4Z1PLM1_9PEZI|nr:carboxyphosphonoenolpyruvate phosphonomutase [Venturia nashicola]TLD38701.1 carboxyphosphonoenolpyruvate phosphonomutase [Venturia nashicola]